MAKAPAFQFYVKDWLSDPLLRQATPVSRGIWIDVLCFMWEADKRGELKTTPMKLSRMVSASIDEVNHFLNEIYDLEFGNIEIDENVTFPIMELNCNTKVTLVNRRMYSDYKDKENTRLRVKKHREARRVKQKGNVKCNVEVTPSSSSPSSSLEQIHPEWLDLPLGKEYKIYRTKIKAPLTDHAKQLSLTALKEQIDAGFKQADIINATIESGKWKSFYPVRGKTGTSTKSTYNFPECSSCGAKASSIKKGTKCNYCGELA